MNHIATEGHGSEQNTDYNPTNFPSALGGTQRWDPLGRGGASRRVLLICVFIVEQMRGQRQTGRNDLPGEGERVA